MISDDALNIPYFFINALNKNKKTRVEIKLRERRKLNSI